MKESARWTGRCGGLLQSVGLLYWQFFSWLTRLTTNIGRARYVRPARTDEGYVNDSNINRMSY